MLRSVVLKRDDDKRELIHRLSEQRKELLVAGGDWDDPPVGVENVAKNVAKIRPPYDYDTLDEWWIHGNWQLIHPVKLDFVRVDAFRNSDHLMAAQSNRRFYVMLRTP